MIDLYYAAKIHSTHDSEYIHEVDLQSKTISMLI